VPQLTVLDACVKSHSKPLLVYTSSRLVYGVPQYLPVDEMHALSPDSLYAIHKMVVERYLDFYQRHHSIPYLNLRIANPYGPGQVSGKRHGIINQFIMNSILREPITLFDKCDVLRDYIYVDDLLKILFKLIADKSAWSKTYNIGRGTGISLHDAAHLICDIVGNQVIRMETTPAEFRDVETGGYITSIKKIKKIIGDYQFVEFSDGIKRSAEYYKSALVEINDIS
jgi:nucleoside-diphosphate-sugar epimerase